MQENQPGTAHCSHQTQAQIQLARRLGNSAPSPPEQPFSSLAHLVRTQASSKPDQVYLSYTIAGNRVSALTYSELLASAERIAAHLVKRLGLGPNDRAATLLTNCPETVIIYLACWLAGITVVPVNLSEDDERMAYILEHSEAEVVFSQADQLTRCREALSQCASRSVKEVIGVGGEAPAGDAWFDDLVRTDVPRSPIPIPDLETEALIVYTSGTTGNPKGVALDHGNILADAASIAAWHEVNEGDRFMCVLPIHHVNGIIVTLVTPLFAGASVVLNQKFSASTFWETLAAERCTLVSIVPTVLAFLCEQPEAPLPDVSALKYLICGAGPLTVELASRFIKRFDKRILHGYGLSETTCYSCFLPINLPDEEYRYWMLECGYPSIGCAISANEMAIHDPHGNPLGPDERGEIVIRGINVMKYYFQRPEANADTFAHGWFRSGDEGFYRKGEDGRDYFFITGRLKELIIRGGVNYSTFEIDEVINRCPGVRVGMAVGFENSFYGEEVGAYVVREEGSDLAEDDVIEFCAQELPYSKQPKVVLFGESFPVTSTGKYQRNRLKPLFAEWKEVSFRPSR